MFIFLLTNINYIMIKNRVSSQINNGKLNNLVCIYKINNMNIFDEYDEFKEETLTKKDIKHEDIQPLIHKIKGSSLFKISLLGTSIENRNIYLIKAGSGKTKVLLWSQMHGNESIGTQALFDIFNFFETYKKYTEEKEKILRECTLYFVPMLNPDGAEKSICRNAAGIDINRDAAELQAPESKILMNLRNEMNADFGFNLHDQEIHYSAGDTYKPATISFLAPAYNKEKSINNSRKHSMQLIVSMNRLLQKIVPGQTGRYSDEFMPSAFGDMIQSKGTSTILIEAGGYKNDPEKQFVRKLYCTVILKSLYSIAYNTYREEEYTEYDKIPFNKKNKLFDHIIRNYTLKQSGKEFTVDIGIRKIDQDNEGYKIDGMGDLSEYAGYNEM